MDNIEYFNRLTLQLFAELYAKFPEPTSLDAHAEADAILPSGLFGDERFKLLARAEHVVTWLESERYLTYGQRVLSPTSRFDEVRLTERGLLAFSSVPDALRNEKGIVEQARELVNAGGADAVQDFVKGILMKASAMAVGTIT